MIIEHLKLYNTQTRKKEKIVPKDGKIIRIYTCGPTIYDFAHIGNLRAYIFEDLLRRSLIYLWLAPNNLWMTTPHIPLSSGVIRKR